LKSKNLCSTKTNKVNIHRLHFKTLTMIIVSIQKKVVFNKKL